MILEMENMDNNLTGNHKPIKGKPYYKILPDATKPKSNFTENAKTVGLTALVLAGMISAGLFGLCRHTDLFVNENFQNQTYYTSIIQDADSNNLYSNGDF
jgi:hypothetical protein